MHDDPLSACLSSLDHLALYDAVGQVRAAGAAMLRAQLPGVGIGEITRVHTPDGWRLAQVTSVEGGEVLLSPLEAVTGVRVGSRVERVARGLTVQASPALRGRVLDGLGRPLDGLGPIAGERWGIRRAAPDPLSRQRINERLTTGVRAIDGLLTLGRGQRVGVFAPAGVGKTTLLGQLARQTQVDTVVAALIGERGREVRAFLEEGLGELGRARTVVVVATADAPAQTRVNAAFVATAIAEYFRDRLGQSTLLLVDSLSRLARAQREVGARAGEWPVREGYPASLFELLATLIERGGNSDRGKMTAVYTLLTPGGEDPSVDPIADEVSGLLDGHIVLSSGLAARGHWPAIDVLGSLSRLFPALTTRAHQDDALRLRQMLAAREAQKDLLALKTYHQNQNPILNNTLNH